ncbi:MAG: staygreen family protein [Anaerolineales bacterium]|nr:staygreen family protein [Anaerolineales bacterium]
MSRLNPATLHTHYLAGTTPYEPVFPRAYTLTQSDSTGDTYLTIGTKHHEPQVSGLHTRFMRDEILAEWRNEDGPSLHVHCHVSGGLAFGTAGWRDSLFRRQLPLVLEAFYCGDRAMLEINPSLENAPVVVHFHSHKAEFDCTENWGRLYEYAVTSYLPLIREYSRV